MNISAGTLPAEIFTREGTVMNKEIKAYLRTNREQLESSEKDLKAIFMGLAATGYAMQMHHDSRPASGSEHLFSHVWEMEGLQKDGTDVSHGFKVGVGLLATSLLMEYIISTPVKEAFAHAQSVLSTEERSSEIDKLLVKNCYGAEPKKISLAKFKTGNAAAQRRELIASVWEELGAKLSQQLYTFEELRAMLKNADCPVTPAEIGLSKEQFLHGIKTAQLIRNRYTILDFLYEAGLLDEAMKNLDRMMQ